MESNEATNPSSAEAQTPAETTTDQSPAEQQDGAGNADDNAGDNGEDKGASSSKKRAQRVKKGTVPPVLTLEEAASIITDYYEQTGGEQTTYDPLSTITGNSRSSSVFWRKIVTIRNYGLLQAENDVASLTGLGLRIAAPHDPADRADALKQAFLNVEIFKNAYERYKGKILPLDEYLENAFTSYVPKELAREWVEKFKSSLKTAGLIEDRNGKLQVRESVLVTVPEALKEPPPAEAKIEPTGQSDVVQPRVDITPLSTDSTRTPIPLGPGKLAYIELPSGWQSKDLKKLLRLLTLALGEDSEESEKILQSL
jgi:hypothetical protein